MQHKLVTKYMWLMHALRLSLLNRHRFIHTGEVLSRGQMGIRAGGEARWRWRVSNPAVGFQLFRCHETRACTYNRGASFYGVPQGRSEAKLPGARPGMEGSSDVTAAL